MLRGTFQVLLLTIAMLPPVQAAKWLEDEPSIRVYTEVNKPFIPDTTGAVVINGYNINGIPKPETDLFSINVTVPDGVGSFILEPENFRHDGRFFISDLSQTKNGVKYPLDYYIRIEGLSGTYVKGIPVYRSPGENIKFYGVYSPSPSSALEYKSGYPAGIYSGTVKITYFSR